MQIDETSSEDATIDHSHGALYTGKISARELVEDYLRRINTEDHSGPQLNTVVTLNDAALKRAEELDAALTTVR